MTQRLCGWIRVLAFILPILCVSTVSESAHAYAWMIKHEYTSCATCHADPSGGELLTKYGRVTSQIALATKYSEPAADAPPPGPGVLWGLWDTPDWLLISGAYRSLLVVRPEVQPPVKFVPVMMGDLNAQLNFGPVIAGGSLGLTMARAGSMHGRAAQVTSAPDGSLNMISRTHYVGAHFGDVWIRGGRLNLPFGVRIPEHTMWVREATRTDRESDQQHGVSFAYVGTNLRFEVMGILGNYQVSGDEFRERGYSLFLEGISEGNFAAGVSSKLTYAKMDRVTYEDKSLRQAHGLTMRFAPNRWLTLLGEVDGLFRSGAAPGYVGFAQADIEPVQGLHLILTGEVVDEGHVTASTPYVDGAGKPRLGGWASLDWFFLPQLEARIDAVMRQNEPFTLLTQLHFYL